MNQNEASNIELNKNESVNDESNQTNNTNENSTKTTINQKLKKVQNETHFVPTLEEVGEVLESQPNVCPPTSKCKSNTLDDAMPYTKEIAADENTKNLTAQEIDSSTATKDVVNITSSAERLIEDEQQSSRSSQLSSTNKDGITCESASTTTVTTTLITAATMTTVATATATATVASPSTLPVRPESAETAKPADVRQLHYVASAPILSCVPLRANQQQQQKIKCYHDAKQTALWDTKSSTSSGGAILKSGIYGSPKMLRRVTESASCNMLPRRVSFPKSDKELVTGYLEPANPWEHVSTVSSVAEIAELYTKSCHKHHTRPLPDIMDQLKAVELNKLARQPILSLKKVQLKPSDCEALEEVLKRVQYKCIDLSSCELEENAISALCEIIEYYEAANELNLSTNPKGMTHRGWISCAYMVGRSQELHVLNAEGNPISKSSAEHLGNALSTSNLHTVKLEHCGLKGAPLSGLCMKLRHNKILKELWLAHNDLDYRDAESIAELLKVNHFLELVDISNNNIGDNGLKYIVEALIVQSKELERRSMFQRAAAIEDDIFSPVDGTTINEPETLTEKHFDSLGSTKSDGVTEKSDDNDISPSANADVTVVTSATLPSIEDFDCEKKKNNANDLLLPDLVVLKVQNDNVPATYEAAALNVDETEAEDDTEDTVKSNTIKSKQQHHQHQQHQHQTSSVVGGGQSMLDKLLSMNSDSSSEEASNLSTDTIAACGSDDTSFVSDDIFDVGTVATIKTNTCANTKSNTLATLETATACVTTATLPLSLNTEGNHHHENQNDCIQKNVGRGVVCDEKNINCDTCTLEASNNCNCSSDMRNECHNNNYNNNNKNTNKNNINNNSNRVQKQENDLTESTCKHDARNERTQPSPTDPETKASFVTGADVGGVDVGGLGGVFEVRAEESDCLVPPCSTANKSNVHLLQHPTSAVDVNKNTRLVEDYDDTHSTDSAFESASEGDISRTLPEEFSRLSTSLESTRIDIAKELAIETATIASESTEYLAEVGTMPPLATRTTTQILPLAKVGKQKSDEVKTKNNEVHFNETAVMMESSEPSQQNETTGPEECSIPKVSIETDSGSCIEECEERTNNPIPTPPPPSTSPGGISLSMRRTDSSCNFMNQSTRNHSQSSDSLCSDNSLDGSVSSELNLSTSASSSAAQLNEKFTKNDTLTRQQPRQCDANYDSSARTPGGLKALAVWNNNLTKEAGLYIADLLAQHTTSLELLNIGKNCLSNDFLQSVKESLTRNTTLTTLGLQSAHLSAKGIETLASILAFGGNSTLQRIDIRDNKLEVESLTTLADALKSNTTVTQIDIDDEPKRLSVGSDAHLDYVRVVENVRSMCSRNEKTQAQLLAEKAAAANSNKRRIGYYVGSRKISLTCHSRPLIDYSVAPAVTMPSVSMNNNKLEVKRKTGVRLRSPVPSPPTMSPSSSPNRQSRFQVFRVNEVSPLTSPASNSAPIPTLSYSKDSPSSANLASSSSFLTTSTSLPSMATVTSTTQTVRRQYASSPRSRFHVSKIYEDPKVPLAKRSLPPITPPIHLPPTPMAKSAPKTDNIQSNESLTQRDIQSELFKLSSNTIDHNPMEKAQLIRCPIAVFNENDITLTHNATNNDKLFPAASIEATGIVTKDEVVPPASNSNTVATSATQQVARSWIGIGNPTAVDKLLTLFQNPATIFQRSSSPEHKTVPTHASVAAESATPSIQATQTTNPTQSSIVTALKQSPPTWPKHALDTNVSSCEAEKTLTTSELPKSFLGAASKQLRDFGKQVFRQNVASASMEEIINVSTDNLLAAIPAPTVEGNDDCSKLNMKFFELRPTDVMTTTTTTTTTMESDNHAEENSTASEDKAELTVAARLEDINVSAGGTQEFDEIQPKSINEAIPHDWNNRSKKVCKFRGYQILL